MLAITDKARAGLKELAAQEGESLSVVRIVMMGFG
jgi:Fe-S cluster assembly iron-binding protein IscA